VIPIHRLQNQGKYFNFLSKLLFISYKWPMYLKIGKTVLQIMALAKKQKDSIPGSYYGFSKALGFCWYLKTHSLKLTFFGGGGKKDFISVHRPGVTLWGHTKAKIQLHLETLPGGGAVTSDQWPILSGLHFLSLFFFFIPMCIQCLGVVVTQETKSSRLVVQEWCQGTIQHPNWKPPNVKKGREHLSGGRAPA
jgi:hypothetical protein